MQWEGAIAAVDRRSVRTWLVGGLLGAVVPLLVSLATPLPVDLVLAVVSLGSIGTAFFAVRLKARLRELPLEIAPVVGTGVVDGVRVYRFLVRLGRGRLAAMPIAKVTWVDEDDERRALRAEVPGDEFVGPFVILVPDPGHLVGGGRFEIRVGCEEGHRRWEVHATLPAESVREGWFSGLALAGGTVRFDPDWTQLRRPG